MNSAIFILANRPRIPELKESAIYFDLEGKSYLQEINYVWNNLIVMKTDILPDWLIKKLPKELIENTKVYLVDNHFADLLENSVNNQSADDANQSLELVYEIINSSNVWGLVFLENWDSVKEIKALNSNEALEELKKSLNWNNERFGFAYYQLEQS
ncbi:MAG: hypothetical protein ACOH5I_25370 [Oligoflexus sp.]